MSLLAIKAIVVPFLVKSFDTRATNRLFALCAIIVGGVRVSFRLADMIFAFVADRFARIVRVVLVSGSNTSRTFLAVQSGIIV